MAISKIGSKALVDCSVAATDIADGSITAAKLAGSIANAKLANSSITVNGTSVSLGASGSIPAVSWQSVKTNSDSPVTLVAGNGYFMDTTSGAITATLPGSPSAGDTIAIKDYAGTFGTNNLTIGRNGNNIQGVANDSLISTNRASLILVYSDATKGWLYTNESNVADLGDIRYVTATGGTVTTSSDYKIHTFTGDGCFVVSCAGNPFGSATVDYLVVAGGGGTGRVLGGATGGGGAGGHRSNYPSGCAGLSVSSTTYPITVGGGGSAGSPSASGTSGSNSIFSTITSSGGGRGGACQPAGDPLSPLGEGVPGGSGGGGALRAGCSPVNYSAGGTGNTPPVSPPQGNNGGQGYHQPGVDAAGGGGGGAGGAGSDGALNTGGNGGNGTANSITGSPVTRAGGGGGGADTTAGSGGPGGGGRGGIGGGVAVSGTANTGGGGGGVRCGPGQGAGGKGIVIIRYKFQ